MADKITYNTATGAQLERIVMMMETTLKNENKNHVMMACLSLVLILQVPDISGQQLIDGVRDVSEWVALYASTIGSPDVKLQAN